jgi:serine protease Do
MSLAPRYITVVRRSTLLAASLAGITTLLAGATAMGGPPRVRAHHKRGVVTYNAHGGNVTIIVAPPPAAAAPAQKPAEKSSDAPADKQKLSAAEKPAREDPLEKARKGVVVIERAGEIVGMGTVLANDGRVLTALSPLGDGNNLDVRYPDGTTSKAKVNHSDRLWDLAMLVPAVGKYPDGLSASEHDATEKGLKLTGFTPSKGKAQASPLAVKGRRSLLGADETMLRNVFDINTKVSPKELGSPVVDENGDVVAMLGRACLPVEKGPCSPTPFGVPVTALRGFLAKAPPSALKPIAPQPWLGLQGTPEKSGPVQGVRVQGVAPDSSAEDAGLKGGDKAASDVIVAVNDQPVATPEALAKQIQGHAVGDRVKLLLFNNGKFRESTLVLRPAPAKK